MVFFKFLPFIYLLVVRLHDDLGVFILHHRAQYSRGNVYGQHRFSFVYFNFGLSLNNQAVEHRPSWARKKFSFLVEQLLSFFAVQSGRLTRCDIKNATLIYDYLLLPFIASIFRYRVALASVCNRFDCTGRADWMLRQTKNSFFKILKKRSFTAEFYFSISSSTMVKWQMI